MQDLENYILELIPTLPQLDGLEKSFYSFYVCTAVRKFFFFLDPLRTGETKPLHIVKDKETSDKAHVIHYICGCNECLKEFNSSQDANLEIEVIKFTK